MHRRSTEHAHNTISKLFTYIPQTFDGNTEEGHVWLMPRQNRNVLFFQNKVCYFKKSYFSNPDTNADAVIYKKLKI